MKLNFMGFYPHFRLTLKSGGSDFNPNPNPRKVAKDDHFQNESNGTGGLTD